jgi:Putative restriction endonuclease
MNEAVRHMPATTQAADGLPRRRWTFDEIVHLTELGVFGGIDRPRERFELIGGEIVPLSPKGNRHEWLKKELLRHWLKQAAADVDIISETTLRFSDVGFVEPDIFIWPRSIPLADIACNTALLLVEIADASFSFDTNTKTKLYASLGLRESRQAWRQRSPCAWPISGCSRSDCSCIVVILAVRWTIWLLIPICSLAAGPVTSPHRNPGSARAAIFRASLRVNCHV